ncbi:MAG: ABC transporter permease [Parvibaculum sp.]
MKAQTVSKSNIPAADIFNSLFHYELWVRLAFSDIQSKYRRSFFGPMWLVLGTGITIGLMSILWTTIFNLDWRSYLNYIVVGIVTWTLISNVIIQSCDLFVREASPYLRATPLPATFHALRFVARTFIMFFHYLIIILMSLLITWQIPSIVGVSASLAGLLVMALNCYFASITFGIAGARLGDFSPFVTSIMGPLMLLTPVIWKPEMLGQRAIIAEFNPFTHFLAVVRDPLLGSIPGINTYITVFAITIGNIVLATYLYHRLRDKIVYWI